eukprot:gb/GECH01011004.1/.p1 GENE.gb/GECH01011004.1/~~gb/GECH01011004.1/.p1  ORF type:complete len:269 (+),score=61.38 gb/GECH01011004.1/:1-807(+)
MPLYEAVVILGASHKPSRVSNVLTRHAGTVVNNGGVVRRLDNMGISKLAYPMKRWKERHHYGRYVYMLFDCGTNTINRLNSDLSKDEHIFRWAVYKQKQSLSRSIFEDKKFQNHNPFHRFMKRYREKTPLKLNENFAYPDPRPSESARPYLMRNLPSNEVKKLGQMSRKHFRTFLEKLREEGAPITDSEIEEEMSKLFDDKVEDMEKPSGIDRDVLSQVSGIPLRQKTVDEAEFEEEWDDAAIDSAGQMHNKAQELLQEHWKNALKDD